MKKNRFEKIVMVGAGNLATHLAKALYHAGFTITQIYSRTEESAHELAQKVNATYTTSINDIITDATIYIVALRDKAVEALLPSLLHDRDKAAWIHTAGSLPLSIWNDKVKEGGVLYPLQSFSRHRNTDFSQIPIFIEATDAELLKELETVGKKIGKKVYHMNSDQRKHMHMAAIFANNFTNHMYAITERLLRSKNIPFEVVLPLIDETARKIHDLSPIDAQTGPAIRYDENVMQNHIAMLQEYPDMQEIYKMMSKDIHDYHQNKE